MDDNGKLESQNKRQSERHVKDKSSSKKDEETANGESKQFQSNRFLSMSRIEISTSN
jgi:hypothetical protein